MKVDNMYVLKGVFYIVVIDSYFFGLLHIKTEYRTKDNYNTRVRTWLKMPNLTLVGWRMSMQLDEWLNNSNDYLFKNNNYDQRRD